MDRIDQATFEFDPKVGIIIGFMVAVMVFGVALDLRWEQFRRVFRNPKAPIMGLVAQFLILPAAAFAIGRLLVDTPSVALGLVLVACCPGGSVSNYMAHLAKGNVATSVTITAITTVTSLITTPLLFASLASANPATLDLLREIGIEPGELAMMFLVTVGLPIAGGMLLLARRPELAAKIRVWVRRVAMVLFVFIVGTGTILNLKLLADFAGEALLPVVLTCALALAVGWGLGRLAGLGAADRRAVTIEAGVAVTCAIYGAVQIVLIVPTVVLWSRLPPPD